jgi:hypothetical protein
MCYKLSRYKMYHLSEWVSMAFHEDARESFGARTSFFARQYLTPSQSGRVQPN